MMHVPTADDGPVAAAAPNLTREQAARRSVLLSVDSYDITVDVTDGAGAAGSSRFPVRVVIRFTATRISAGTFLDFVGEQIIGARLNGRDLDVSGWTCTEGLAVTGLVADNVLEVDAVALFTNTGEGLHRFVDPEDGEVYLYSQFETADAKRLYPCFDQPDLKATFTMTVTAPAGWQVISNGASSEQETVAGGAVRHRFATTERMSTYVTALIAGPYAVVRDQHDGIELGLFCRKGLAASLDSDRLFAETKQGFDFYHRAFGVRYPFGKYDQLFVPEFNAGAMENAGAVTFREEYVFRSKVTQYSYERRCETLLHEMAHMWFGDLVTMRWWDDLWLNESFATWASVVAQVEATEYTGSWTTFATIEKAWAYVQDQLPSTHPISADMVDLEAVKVNFDGITYAKGASVLKQLAAYVGQQEFLAGLQAYFKAHAFANATLADLLQALEQESGRDLTAWGAAWLHTTGLNPLSAEYEIGPDGRFTSFAVRQGPAAPGAGELRPHRLAVAVYDEQDGALVRAARAEVDLTGETAEVAELIGTSAGVFVLVNDDDLTYGKVRLDPRSQHAVVSRVGDIAESLPRSLIWSALWEMTRDALLPTRDFLTAVLSGLSAETEIGVVQRLLSQVQLAVGLYAEPRWAQLQGWPRVTGALVELAHRAEPGSDVQLAAVNSLGAAALDADQLSLVGGWRDGSAPLPGLTVDTDLAWTLLGALVAHGAADDADIEAAVAADQTASGQRRATTIRALRPGPEQKEAVWTQLFTDDSMANAMQDAAIAGFAHPAQYATLAPFVARYFQSIDEVWSRRSSEAAQRVVIGLYPRWSVSATTESVALDWELGEHPSALRRLVSEGRSSTQRALRARACDGGVDAA